MWIIFSFILFMAFVAFFSWLKLRKESLNSKDGYFLAGRSLSAGVIAASMVLTNISTEHLIGMNGDAFLHGFIVISWETTSAIALVIGALYFLPRYLKMGLTTIPQYLEYRFDGFTRTLVALILIISFALTLLPIVLFTGAINFESIFGISEELGISNQLALWLTVIAIGLIGSIYAIFGGLKAVAYSDTLYGYGLLLGGLMVPVLALYKIGEGNILEGLLEVHQAIPEKFSVIGEPASVMPFGVLFTGLVINQLYFWCMNQAIIQRALGAKNLAEAQKGLMLAGLFKILIPIIIILPGVIGIYYFGSYTGEALENGQIVYPELVKAVVPLSMLGFFAAVIMGAVLSSFNSVLNSAATIFSVGIYKRHLNRDASEQSMVKVGKLTSAILALIAIVVAPFMANAPDGLYQLLQTLNGIYFIPVASILLAGFFIPKISATGAKAGFFFGLFFYILLAFILDIDNRENLSEGRFYLHFIHIWGIEFVLNILVMYVISLFAPRKNALAMPEAEAVDVTQWKYARPIGAFLVVITILVYIWLS